MTRVHVKGLFYVVSIATYQSTSWLWFCRLYDVIILILCEVEPFWTLLETFDCSHESEMCCLMTLHPWFIWKFLFISSYVLPYVHCKGWYQAWTSEVSLLCSSLNTPDRATICTTLGFVMWCTESSEVADVVSCWTQINSESPDRVKYLC